jgi:hypothetical protein
LSSRQITGRASNAILHAAATDWVNIMRASFMETMSCEARPSLSAIEGFNHRVRADAGRVWPETREEEIDYPVAVSTDCGA